MLSGFAIEPEIIGLPETAGGPADWRSQRRSFLCRRLRRGAPVSTRAPTAAVPTIFATISPTSVRGQRVGITPIGSW